MKWSETSNIANITNMIDNSKEQQLSDIDNIYNEYTLIVKTMPDILEALNLSEDDELLYKSIIVNLEDNIANNVKKGYTVNIPNIGRLRRNPVQQAVVRNYDKLKEARTRLNKEEYKDFVSSIISEERNKDAIKQHEKRTIRRLKSANSGLYDYYVKNMGVAYANLYIKSLLWVDAIAFDQDVQDAYDAINNNK